MVGVFRANRDELSLLIERRDELRVMPLELIIPLLEECRVVARTASTCQIPHFRQRIPCVDVDGKAADVLGVCE